MTFQIGDRVVVTMRNVDERWQGRKGVVIRLNITGYTGDVTEIRFTDGVAGMGTNKFFTHDLTLIAPLDPEQDTATLRGRIQARIDMYKSIEHPGGIALGIIEELEGVLRDA